MNLAEIYNTEKKSEEKKKPSSESSVKKIVDKFSIFASISANIKLIRQDIAKLVKLQGIKPTTKSESFFSSQKEKENVYESKIQKIKSTSPTKVETKPTKTESAGPFDFLKSILSLFIKGGVLTAFIGGIGSLLQDPEIRKNLKEFFVGAVEFVLKGVREATTFIGEILQDDRVIQSIIDTVRLIFSTLKDVIVKIWNTEVDTEYGKFSVGGIVGLLVGALVAFKFAVIAASAALGAIASGLGGSVGRPGTPGGPAGRTPAPGAPPTGAPGGPAGRTPAPGAPPTKTPGFLKTSEDLIRERAERMAAEKGTKAVGEGAVKRFMGGALKFLGGAVLSPLGVVLTATTVYDIMDALAPDEQQQFIDSLEVIASVQEDIDSINSEPNTSDAEKLKRINKLKQMSNVEFHQKRIDKLTKVKAPTEAQQTVQAAPSAPDQSAAETARLAAAAQGRPTAVPSGSSDMRQGRSYNRADVTPTPAITGTPTSTSNLLNIIASGESGSMGYDAANKGKAGDMPNGYPGLSKMTVGEVMQLQSNREVFAAGKYQIIPTTLKGLLAGSYGDTGVKSTDLYDASTQDKLATTLVNYRLKRGGNDPLKQQFELAQEFASIANPYTGSSYYSGIGNNKASISTQAIQTALSGTAPTVMAAAPTSPTVMAAAPTGGQKVMAASADFSDFMRQVLQPTVNVIAPTTNNNVQQPARQMAQQNYTQPSVVDTEFMKLLVGRTVNL